MATNIKTIKDYIKTQLDALVTAGTLGYAGILDLKKDPLDETVPAWPAAFVTPPATESTVEDNRTIMRTYTFDILVMVKAENITGTSDVETLLEALLNKFDNLPTMAGAADGAVDPATSMPEAVQTKNGDMIVFSVRLKVNRTEGLTY